MNPTCRGTIRLSAGFVRRVSGFTLVELLTVIAIVAILAGIIIPTVATLRRSARTTQCLSNLRQIAAASLLYSQENKGVLPDGSVAGQSGFYVTQIMRYQLINYVPRKAGDDVWFCPGQPNPVTFCYYPNPASRGVRMNAIPAPTRFILWRDRAEDPAVNADSDVTPGSHGPHQRMFNVCFVDGHTASVTTRQELVDLLAQPAK